MTVVVPRSALLLACGLCVAVVASAQAPDARVAPPGVLRVEVGGSFSQFDARYGALDGTDGTRAPLSAPFPSRLTAPGFAPLTASQTALNAFFTQVQGGTAGFAADPENLFFTTTALNATADHRLVPMTLELGILPRISLRARVPLTHQRLDVTGFAVGEGTLGRNPDPLFNRELLGGISAGFAALGGAGLLPVADSNLGREMQARVRAAVPGGELRLPTAPLAVVGVGGITNEAPLRTGRYDPTQPLWAIGDVEVGARIQLLEIFGDADEPGEPRRVWFRSAAEAGIRIASGPTPTADYLVLPPPDEGVGGWLAALHGELYAPPRLAVRASARLERRNATTIGRRTWQASETFPPTSVSGTARWNPGSILSLDVAPGFQLVEEITLFGRYNFGRRSGGSVTPTDGAEPALGARRTVQRVGIGAMYSTPPTGWARRGGTPFEAELVVSSTFAGSGGAVAGRSVEMGARLFPRFWGR
jgi:hypothetical protein